MKRLLFALVTTVAVFLGSVRAEAAGLLDKIAETHQVLGEDEWYGFHRIKFGFHGFTAWVVEPSVETADGTPWTWTMQWAEAFVDRTGVLDLLREGYHHVTLEAFGTRACDESLPVFAAFQEYLVNELGFRPEADLVGMSWGGFFSVRYAVHYPQNVHKIYLDAPLMVLWNRKSSGIGPWEDIAPENYDWSNDPRMPVNMAPQLVATGIPVLLLYGGQDQTCIPSQNCELFVERYKAAGGEMQIEYRGLYGHHPHGMDPDKTALITDFFKK